MCICFLEAILSVFLKKGHLLPQEDLRCFFTAVSHKHQNISKISAHKKIKKIKKL